MSLSEKLHTKTGKIIIGIISLIGLMALTEVSMLALDGYIAIHEKSEYVLQIATKELINKAYAGEMNKIPGLDYVFDGGVYECGTPDYPKDRVKPIFALNKSGGDIENIVKVEELYKFIGKHVEPMYENGKLIGLAYDPDNPKMVGIAFKIGEKYYHAFKKINPTILKTLQTYDKK